MIHAALCSPVCPVFHDKQNQSVINNWFYPQNIDKIYGPKELLNGVIKLGKKEINFDGRTLIIEDNSYFLTLGLEQLLFLKNPKSYTSKMIPYCSCMFVVFILNI